MDEQSGIKLQNNVKNIQSIEALKHIGMDLLQNLSGELWSDYNIHDPGITTLEVLCYVITELGYRTETAIEDIFVNEKTPNNSFFEAHDILNSGAITLRDLKKIILDIQEVRNVNIIPSKKFKEFTSLYTIWIELMDSDPSQSERNRISTLVLDKVNSNRTIGLDFDDICLLNHDKVGIELSVEVDGNISKNKILKDLLKVVDSYFSPLPIFNSLNELVEEGSSTEEVFEGPTLKSGFLSNDSLKESEIKSHLYVSDLINHVMDVTNVKNIKKINLLDQQDKSYNWVYKVKDNCVARLDLEKTTISVTFQNNELFNLSSDNISVDYISTKTKAAHKNNKLKIKQGNLKDLKQYRSIQYDFPSIYGVGEYGASNTWNKEKVAYVKQFKSFLTFFDQILANYFAQLNHLPELYSLKEISETTAVQWIDELPKPYLIFKPFLESCLLKNLDIKDESILKKEWNTWIEKNKKKQKEFLQKIVESPTVFLSRRKKILDHLLARFGYDFSSFDMVSMLSDRELISHKLNFLKALPSFGKTKYYGLLPSGNNPNDLYYQSGFKNYLINFLGLRGKENESLSSSLKKIMIQTEKGSSTELIFRQENISEGIKKIFSQGIDEENYIKVKNNLYLKDQDNNKICEIKFSSSELTKEEQKRGLSEAIKSVGIRSESFYLLDHILLRPNEKLKAFGFNVHVDNKIIFSSPLNLTKAEQTNAKATFKAKAFDKSSYEIIEIAHNQYKISIDNLGSTLFFEKVDEAQEAIDYYTTFFESLDTLESQILDTTKYNHIYNEINDPFSNIISIILPNWPKRFQSVSFQNFISDSIVEESPAHVFVNIRWMNYEEIIQLEKAYTDYRTCELQELEHKEKKLETLLLFIMKDE